MPLLLGPSVVILRLDLIEISRRVWVGGGGAGYPSVAPPLFNLDTFPSGRRRRLRQLRVPSSDGN